jgi:hypothetical protein
MMLFVRTNESGAAAAARVGAQRALREKSALIGLLLSCFARTQAWLQAGKFMNTLVSGLPSRNGWTIAEQVGDRRPRICSSMTGEVLNGQSCVSSSSDWAPSSRQAAVFTSCAPMGM